MERINPYLNNIAFYLLLVFSFVLMISNALAETIVFIILVIWIAQTLAYRRKEWLDYPLFMPLTALIGYKTIVLLVSGYQGRFGTALEQIALPLIYFIVPTIVVTPERRRKVIWLVISGAVLAAGIGIIRYALGDVPRAVSIISGTYTLAIFLTIVIGIVLSIFVYSKNLHEKIFLGLVSIPLFAGILFSLTRTVYVVVGLYVLIMGIFKDRILLLISIVIISAIFIFSPSSRDMVQKRFDFSHKKSFYSYRDILFEKAKSEVDNVSFFGNGLNSFPAVVDIQQEFGYEKDRLKEWHNMYFETLFDGGPFALFALLWVLFSQIRFSFAKFRKTLDKEHKMYQLGVLLILLCIIIVGFVDNGLNDQIISMLMWLLLGLSII